MTVAQFLTLLALLPGADAGDDAKTLQTIRAAVHENFTSIHSLQLRFHTYDPETDTHFVDWSWTIQGNKFLLVSGPGIEFGKSGETRWWCSFDGKTYFDIDYDPDDLSALFKKTS